jgi:tetratricopeptide (TPR) repeat protein
LYEFIFFGFSGRKLIILLAPLLLGAVVGAIGLVFTDKPLGVLLSDVTEMGRETTVISRFDYLVTQFSVIATYLRLLVLPVNQNLDYDYPVYLSLLQPKPLLGLLLHLALIGVAIYALIKAGEGRKAKGERQQEGTSSGVSLRPSPGALRLVSFGILWFEHRAYLPSVGFVMAVTAGMVMLARTLPGRVLATVGAILLVGMLVTTIQRNRVWQSQLSLWGDSLVKSPNKMRPYYNVGCEYVKQNDIDKAISYLNKAVSLKEDQYQCHTNLGGALLKVKRTDEAMYHLQRAIELNPSSAVSHFNLGLVYAIKGRSDEALASVEKAIALNPANQEYRKNLEILRSYLQK